MAEIALKMKNLNIAAEVLLVENTATTVGKDKRILLKIEIQPIEIFTSVVMSLRWFNSYFS